MQQLNFLVVLASFVIATSYIRRILELLCVNMHDLFDHSMQQVNPLLAVLDICLIGLVILKCYNFVSICLLSVKITELTL